MKVSRASQLLSLLEYIVKPSAKQKRIIKAVKEALKAKYGLKPRAVQTMVSDQDNMIEFYSRVGWSKVAPDVRGGILVLDTSFGKLRLEASVNKIDTPDGFNLVYKDSLQ